jgi:SNF2 family DNA or RNA helicase
MSAIPWNPRPYQEASLAWMIEKPHCGLLLDPGLGKTSVTLAAILFLKEQGFVYHALVVAPLRVAKTVWPVEARKWIDFQGMTICSLCEMEKDERIEKLRQGYDVYVINPESLIRVLEIDPWFYMPLNMLVVDESTKFKDSQTQRFKALKKYLHKFDRRVILTGTPAPNGLADLFGQMYVCDMGESLGKYITHFRQRYMFQSHDGYTWEIAPGAAVNIYDRVKGRLLRMMARDHLDMPELINNYIKVKLPEKSMREYRELERDFLIKINDRETLAVFNTAALGTKLRQVANGFIYDEDHKAHLLHTEKMEALRELLDEMQGRPLLLCYEFIQDAASIQLNFPYAINISESRNTEAIVNAFNAGKIPLLIGHPKSMGHGLNLQEICKDICWYGITWDLELYQQAIARVWRQGQMSTVVMVHHIVAERTKDEDVIKALAVKDVNQNSLNEAIKSIVPRP